MGVLTVAGGFYARIPDVVAGGHAGIIVPQTNIQEAMTMKQFQTAGVVAALVCSLFLPFSANVSAAGSRTPPEPIFTRYARIQQGPVVDFGVEYFRDKPVEEAEDFDGYTLATGLTWPINDRSQFQVLLPFYTNGDATLASSGNTVDIEGYNGVFDFFTVLYERRFGWLEGVTGSHVAWRAGLGWSLDPLEVERNGTLVDRYNHSGYNIQLGLAFDDDVSNGDMTLLGDVLLAFYRDSDDLNLSGGASNFTMMTASGAVMSNRYGRFRPVLEAILEADFKDYVAFSLAPEAIYTFGEGFDAKLGVPFRLTSDGQKYAVNLELSYRF